MKTQSVLVKHRSDFREWLKKNHDKEKKVAVILNKKHTGIPSPSHRELMEEAICFGWIDTRIDRIDDNQFIRNFSRRNKNSKWSYNTLSYAKQLVKEKKMTPIGMKFYKEGLSKPTHDHGIPKNPSMPDEISKVLKKNKDALKNFKSFSPSYKRTIYRWFLSAKRDETKIKRIKKIFESSKQNQRMF